MLHNSKQQQAATKTAPLLNFLTVRNHFTAPSFSNFVSDSLCEGGFAFLSNFSSQHRLTWPYKCKPFVLSLPVPWVEGGGGRNDVTKDHPIVEGSTSFQSGLWDISTWERVTPGKYVFFARWKQYVDLCFFQLLFFVVVSWRINYFFILLFKNMFNYEYKNESIVSGTDKLKFEFCCKLFKKSYFISLNFQLCPHRGDTALEVDRKLPHQ